MWIRVSLLWDWAVVSEFPEIPVDVDKSVSPVEVSYLMGMGCPTIIEGAGSSVRSLRWLLSDVCVVDEVTLVWMDPHERPRWVLFQRCLGHRAVCARTVGESTVD